MTDKTLDESKNTEAVSMGLIKITWPIFLEVLLTYLINFTDILFLNKISEQSAAAIGTLMPVVVIPIVILHSLSIGTTGVLGRMLGAKIHEKLEKNYLYTVIFNFLIGLTVMVAYLLLHNEIGTMMGLSSEMNDLTSAYLLIFTPALLIKSIQIGYGSILNVNGWTKLNMQSTLVANAVNIILNTLFLFGGFDIGFNGVECVALASALSYFTGLAIVIYFVHVKKNIKFDFSGSINDFKTYMAQVLKIGVPATMEPMSYELNRFFITITVISLGALAISTRIYTLNLILIPIIFSQSIGVGNRIIISHLLGAGDHQKIKKQINQSITLSVAGSTLMLFVIWMLSDYAFLIFTQDAEILALGATLLAIDILRHPAGAINMVVVNSLVVSGDAKYPVGLSITSMWLLCLPMVYFFAIELDYGLIGVWLALLVDEYIRCAICLTRWRNGHWKKQPQVFA
ncbi:MATE family efflux transporter [Enterovibrio calviensis]|uniref:MATE family efflux transporter n=1 Tax=Enterovibrio calviensis TaxID=91359 RepID=UPI000486DEEB|nr:MATE family efflux transporter [Enterovibrio calviensis]